jgi:hypothetical protein
MNLMHILSSDKRACGIGVNRDRSVSFPGENFQSCLKSLLDRNA